MIFSPSEHPALWSALLALPVSWDALPKQGVTLSGGAHLLRQNAPDGTLYLNVTFHESEDFQALQDGRGDYTEEELDDPDAVIEQRWAEAREVMWNVIAEAAQVLGEPAEAQEDAPGRVNWLLADRTISVGLFQADRDCPVEVCLWLLPPGLTADSLEL
ncbi:hypothetical protein [Deinococcus alpinitundrae]|uniref:hypothetical protein n=1 Tax=Deinococcus alpinitundrae TaxID=468913 RepID=UPI00137B1B30|nr:hypothetical protein [Deinococcus alpinitundrae]